MQQADGIHLLQGTTDVAYVVVMMDCRRVTSRVPDRPRGVVIPRRRPNGAEVVVVLLRLKNIKMLL